MGLFRTDRRLQFAKMLVLLSLSLAACASAAVTPTATLAPTSTPPTLTATPAETPTLTPGDSVSVAIVEPAFQPPQNWAFTPAALTIKTGTKITWTNSGAALHTVTADDGQAFNSGDLAPQAIFSITAATVGTLTYHCKYHLWMTGTLIVLP